MPNNKKRLQISRPKSRVSAPVARSLHVTARKPEIISRGDTYVVRHKEYCGAVVSSVGPNFALSALSASTPGYDLNPGNPILFPWCSSIARNYEQYRFRKMQFELVSSQATTSPGRVYMAVDYDYDDPVASNVQELMGNATKTSVAIWESPKMAIDPASLHRDLPYKYCLASKRADPEPRTVYGGFLMIGFQGQLTVATFDLWVEYEVEFKIPQLDTTVFVDTAPATTSMANVTTSGTSGYSGILPVALPVPVPGLKRATPGDGNTPPMLFNGQTVTAVYDMAQFLAKLFHISGDFNESAITCANLLLKKPVMDGAFFDSVGTFLGRASDVVDFFMDYLGPRLPELVNTAAAGACGGFSFSTQALHSLYPSARYMAPVVESTNAIGAGNARTYFTGLI